MRLLRAVLVVVCVVAAGLVVPAGPAGAAVPPLQISKSFSPATVPLFGTTRMTLTITNPATVEQTGVAVIDTFPSGLQFASPPNLSRTCTGDVNLVTEAPFEVELSDGTIPASSSCTLQIDLKATSNGVQTNTTGNVTSTEGGVGNTATASITVVAAPPSVLKTFTPTSIPVGGSTTLQINVSNPNSSTLTGVMFTDTMDDGLVVAEPNGLVENCDGDVTATPGSNVVSLANETINALKGCIVEVQVTATAAGEYGNIVIAASNESGTTTDASFAKLFVVAPPILVGTLTPSTIPLNGTATMTFTVSNPNTFTALTGVSFFNDFPDGFEPAGLLSNDCDGGVFRLLFDFVALGNQTLPPGGGCSISFSVRGTTLGPKVNTTSPVNSTNGGTGAPVTLTLLVGSPPTIAKTFGNSTIAVGSTTGLTFTLSNPNAAPLTGAAFSDSLPAGLVVASPSGVANSCGGTVTAAAGTSSIALTGGTVPASSNCTVTVNVRATTAGTKTNTTSTLTTTEGLTGTPATASLSVVGPPTLTKAFSPSTVPVGATTTLTFTLTNPNPTTPLTRITFADPFPPGLAVAATPSVTNTCGGVPSVGPFALAVAYANARLPAGGSCTFSVNVTAGSAGVKNNTTTIVSSTPGGIGSPATATMTVTP